MALWAEAGLLVPSSAPVVVSTCVSVIGVCGCSQTTRAAIEEAFGRYDRDRSGAIDTGAMHVHRCCVVIRVACPVLATLGSAMPAVCCC